MRRDSPQVANRVDHQAEAAAHPANPETVLDAFKESQRAAGGLDPKMGLG